MATNHSVTHWVDRLKAGDDSAAQPLWERYYARLVKLARKKLRLAARRVADEDDVALDAFDSFCRGAKEGRFPRLVDRDDLWQLLVMLTARKAAKQAQREKRQKRGGGEVRGESAFKDAAASGTRGIEQVVGAEPTPDFALELVEQFQRLLDGLGDPALKAIALSKMEGNTNREIAERQGCSLSTIERKLRLIRSQWARESEK